MRRELAIVARGPRTRPFAPAPATLTRPVARVVLLNKPFGVLTRFTDEAGRPTLADYVTERDVYAAGRLDFDSEGLLVLTDDGTLQHRLTDPRHKSPKTYYAQVEGSPDEAALAALRGGVQLRDGPTLPARVRRCEPPVQWDRHPPIRWRASIPTQWLEIIVCEGRNRQVRRMTAALGFPTLRLIRWSVGPWTLAGLMPGESRRVEIAGRKLREI